MGKTEKGTLWVTREKTSAFDFFQHFVNCLDVDVERLLRFFTQLPVSEIQAMCKNDIVKAKKLMAFEVTKLVHGEEEAQKTLKTSEELFSKNNVSSENMPGIEIKINEKTITACELVALSKAAKSKGEAKRLIEQGGIKIDGRKITEFDEQIVINKNDFTIQKGKKTFIKIKIK